MKKRLDSSSYYDAMSERYDIGRRESYHFYIDSREAEVLEGLAVKVSEDGVILDGGCGTGLILTHIPWIKDRLFGCDVSKGMIQHAKRRGERVILASLEKLPFRDETFDLVFSFKVLPHIERLEDAVSELIRITKRGGYILLEFYNRYSLRFVIKTLTSWRMSSSLYRERDITTRYVTIGEVLNILPDNIEVIGIEGIRILTPSGLLWKWRGISLLLELGENLLSNTRFKRYAGFLLFSLKKRG